MLSWSGSAARWRSPLPGGLPQARSGSRSALITGSPPAQPTSRSEWTWTVSSTWLKYLGPGRGGSLLLGARVRRAGQQGRQGRPDRRGGTSRTGAKRAGECDGLTGLPEAIEATWPQATVQTCVVHLIRASMRFVSYGDRRKVAAALKTVYTAPNQEAAWQALTDFSESDMGVKYPQTVTTWERAWERFTPFLDFPPMHRRVIYTTNSIESLNYQLRKVSKNRGHFPSDEAVVKLLWLAICDIEDKRARERDKEKGLPPSKRKAKGRLVEGQITTDWNKALAQLATAYPDRINPYL